MNDTLDGSLLILDGATIAELLAGSEDAIVDTVSAAYATHGRGASSLPHSLFLRFPKAPANRIIALPAYVGGPWHVAGLKWIASFPANVGQGLDRASAVLILSSADTGFPYAVLEGSLVSAQRTAASAALAARHLWLPVDEAHVAVIGCGVIGYEIVRFLHRTVRPLRRLKAYDLSTQHARAFAERCAGEFMGATCTTVASEEEALCGADLVVYATTATTPHVSDPALFMPGATVLHVSLRDLAPELILTFDNVVDDVSHVCRAETSVHLAETQCGGRDFIRATLADIVSGAAVARLSKSDVIVFSPFGLGVLDLAVGQHVVEAARERGLGVRLPAFLPTPWSRSDTDAAALRGNIAPAVAPYDPATPSGR